MCSWRPSRDRTTPVAFAPANRAPSNPARMPTRAERPSRLRGIFASPWSTTRSSYPSAAFVSSPVPSLQDTFNQLMGELDYPMFIVTVGAGRGRARAASSASRRSAASIRRDSWSACQAEPHLPASPATPTGSPSTSCPADAADLAELFGGRDERRGGQVREVRVASRARAACRCSRPATNRFVGPSERVDGGDHVGFVSRAVAAEHGPTEGQFPFHRAKRIRAGHPA